MHDCLFSQMWVKIGLKVVKWEIRMLFVQMGCIR